VWEVKVKMSREGEREEGERERRERERLSDFVCGRWILSSTYP
jgi:hypothetical protein